MVSVLLGLGTVLYNSSRGIAPTVMGAFMGFMLWQTLFLAWIGGMWIAGRWRLHVEEKAAPLVWLLGLGIVALIGDLRRVLAMAAMVTAGLPVFAAVYWLAARWKGK